MAKAIIKPISSGLTKLGAKIFKSSAKNYTFYSQLRSIGFNAKGDDVDSLYNAALYEFDQNFPKHPKLVALFARPYARDSFRRDLQANTDHQLLADLEGTVATGEEFEELRGAGVDLPSEIAQFIGIFEKKVNQTLNPKELSMIQHLKSMSGTMAVVSADSFDLSDQLADLEKLRRSNQHEAVKSLLLSHKRDKWDQLSSKLKFALTLQLAFTCNELGERAEAATYFKQLPDFNVKQSEAYGLAAIGYAIEGDNSKVNEYAAKAMALDPSNGNAYLAKLFVADKSITTEEIEEIVPTTMRQDLTIELRIAKIKEEQKKYAEALSILTRLEQQYKTMDILRCEILVMLGVVLINSLPKKADYRYEQLRQVDKQSLESAMGHFTIVWDYFRDTPLRRSYAYVLANRGVALKALGRTDEARKDLVMAFDIKPSYLIFGNLLELSEWDKSFIAKEKSKLNVTSLTPEEAWGLEMLTALELLNSGDIVGASQIASANKPPVDRVSDLIRYYYLRARFITDQQQTDGVEELIKEMIEELPDQAGAYLLGSNLYANLDNQEAAKALLIEAVAYASENTPNQELWDLASNLFDAGLFVEAAGIYRLGADTDLLSLFTRWMLNAEYRAGKYQSAIEQVEHLLAQGVRDPFLYDLKASILEAAHRFDEAKEMIRNYLAVKEDPYFRVKLALLLHKQAKYAEGIEELDKIDSFEKIPVDVQFSIANAYIKAGRVAAGLEIAYRLRAENMNDPAVHHQVLSVQTNATAWQKDDYYPKTVAKDCYVALKGPGGKLTEHIIVDHPKYPHEIGIDEPFVTAMLGKTSGETFISAGDTYTIGEIKSKYTYALHDSMSLIQTRFQNEGPFKIKELLEGQNPLEFIKAIVGNTSDGHSTVKEIDELYTSQKATLGMCARLAGISPIKYWDRLCMDFELGIFSNSSQAEQISAAKALIDGVPMVFDITSLLSLYNTNGFSLLAHFNRTKLVAQSTLEVIEAEIREFENKRGQDDLVLNEVGGNVQKIIVTAARKEEIISWLQSLMKAVNDHFQIVHAPIPINFEETEKVADIMGKSFYDSGEIARDKTGLLVSDDLFFRELIRSEYSVPGLPVTGLIMDLIMEKKITPAEADPFIESLITRNYTFVPVRPELLVRLCTKGQQMLNIHFMRGCDCIHCGVMPDGMAIPFVIKFIKLLCQQVLSSTSRDMVIQFVLSKLFEGRQYQTVKDGLIYNIRKQMSLMPIDMDVVLDIINFM